MEDTSLDSEGVLADEEERRVLFAALDSFR